MKIVPLNRSKCLNISIVAEDCSTNVIKEIKTRMNWFVTYAMSVEVIRVKKDEDHDEPEIELKGKNVYFTLQKLV